MSTNTSPIVDAVEIIRTTSSKNAEQLQSEVSTGIPTDIKCLVVQSDFTITLERNHTAYPYARDFLLRCAELEKCPEHLHTYRLTTLSLWNAAALGLVAKDIISQLSDYSRYILPSSVPYMIRDAMELWGKIQLVRLEQSEYLRITENKLKGFINAHSKLTQFFDYQHYKEVTDQHSDLIALQPNVRGKLKVQLAELGYPVEDLAGYRDGDRIDLKWKETCRLREYQYDAVNSFLLEGTSRGGSGVLVLPCGAGKTVIGMAAMARLGMQTLILASSVTAARQWREELLSKTTISAECIGEYSGFEKELKPITIATYQILSRKKKSSNEFEHLKLLEQPAWGLIIYDEVHLLPAPIFQVTANIQACRRLGLTATLVREDGKEHHVFSLIGPKRYDVPWKLLESQGWIASASCKEIEVELASSSEEKYLQADKRDQFRIAATNPSKFQIVANLLRLHADDPTLIIGLYVDQLEELARYFGLPIIDGATKQKERDALFDKFRKGQIRHLVVSKVANFSIDLPDASVAIQVSGTFGSRQEEAQRLGRILRPKADARQAIFYSLVTKNSEEKRFALNRQLFLIEQGYEYEVLSFNQKELSETTSATL
jgi:DNA excision repair protein ERCC-3